MPEDKNIQINESKMNSFLEKVLGDISGTYVSLMCCIGDRLNLFKKLETSGPTTIQQLSRIVGINERYAKEWLSAMTCAGYLEYATSQRFRLPPEHGPAFTEEGGPKFVSGIYQRMLADVKNMEKMVQIFRQGGGIPLEEFDENKFVGMDRMTASWFENLLLQEWIPTVPDVKTKLEKGALVADVGC